MLATKRMRAAESAPVQSAKTLAAPKSDPYVVLDWVEEAFGEIDREIAKVALCGLIRSALRAIGTVTRDRLIGSRKQRAHFV